MQEGNMIQRELHVTHCNRAGALLKLSLHQDALLDAERARVLAEEAHKK